MRDPLEIAAALEVTLHVPVREASQVSDARRKALALAQSIGLTPEAQDNMALVVSEAGSNLVKHAQEGVCLLRALAQPGPNGAARRGIELLFLDRGPGMANVGACMVDGYSTAGSLGTGFGAMRRLASTFDVYSLPGLGTALLLELWDEERSPDSLAEARHGFRFGAVSVAKGGEPVCGDGWALSRRNQQAALLIVDGLGHGDAAAQASQQAITEFLRAPQREPGRALAELDGVLRGTRGAAAAVVTIDARRGVVSYCGGGNTGGAILHSDGVQRLVSHPGTLGLGLRRTQPFEYRWTPSSTLMLHTDGLSTRWDLAPYVGIAARHPSLLAGVLYRDFARNSDDATVLVLREGK